MVGCSVLGCKSRSERKIRGITFHSFPANSEIRNKWVEATGRQNWHQTNYSKICSIHFEIDSFHYKSKNVVVKPNAMPTKFVHNLPIHRSFMPEKNVRSTLDKRRTRRWSTSTVTQTEFDQDLNSLLDEACSAEGEEEVEESIVPTTKPFTRQKKKKAKRVKIDNVSDTEDNLSMYLDVEVQSSNSWNMEDNNDEVLHEGFVCDVCRCEIKGFRYTCVQCSDLDLCSACELDRAHHHHYVLRVPEPRPYAEIQFVLATIRRHLLKKLDPISQLEQDDDTISIKSEIKSEIEDDELREPAVDADDTPTLHSAVDGDNAMDNMVIDITEETQSNTREEKRNVQNSTEVASLNVAVQQKQQPFSVSLQHKQQAFNVPLQHKQQPVRVTVQQQQQPASVAVQQQPVRVAVQHKQQPVSVAVQHKQQPVRVTVQHKQQPVNTAVQNQRQPVSVPVQHHQQPVRFAVQHKQQPVNVAAQHQQQPASVAVQQQPAVTSSISASTGLHISAKNNNIIIDFNDAPQVKHSAKKAKKIQILPFPKTESNTLTQKLLSQKPLLRPGDKLMLVKCPSGMLLKDGRKVPVQVLPTLKSTSSNADKETVL